MDLRGLRCAGKRGPSPDHLVGAHKHRLGNKVDVIVTLGSPATRAALHATGTIPVVFEVGDPVGSGFATSLAKPGGNGTGVSGLATDLTAKRLEFLREIVPRARRIVYLMNSSNPMAVQLLNETEKAARTLGVQLVTLDARNDGEVDAALRAIPRSTADALLVAPDLLFLANRAKIAQAVRASRLPTMVTNAEYRDAGILMSYGPSLKQAMRRLAVYVDKILKGAKPSDLPIEQMSNYELIIDLGVAHEQRIKVPQELLLRADEVIR